MCSSIRVLAISSFVLTGLQAFSMALTPIRGCANQKPLPLMVQINDCSELPCDFLNGKTTDMAIQFVATKNNMSKIRATAKVTSRRMKLVSYEVLEKHCDVCRNLLFGAYCPLDVSEDVTYHLRMTVNAVQSELPITVQISLMDQSDDEVVACFVVDGILKKYHKRSISRLNVR